MPARSTDLASAVAQSQPQLRSRLRLQNTLLAGSMRPAPPHASTPRAPDTPEVQTPCLQGGPWSVHKRPPLLVRSEAGWESGSVLPPGSHVCEVNDGEQTEAGSRHLIRGSSTLTVSWARHLKETGTPAPHKPGEEGPRNLLISSESNEVLSPVMAVCPLDDRHVGTGRPDPRREGKAVKPGLCLSRFPGQKRCVKHTSISLN